MSKNRIFSLMLAALMCMSLIVPVSAASKPTLTLSGASAEPGDTVTLTVSIKDNPGIAGCKLYFYYDTSVFTASAASFTTQGSFKEGGLVVNTIELADKNGRYDGEEGMEGHLVNWYNASGVNTDSDGKMMTVTFKVASNAKAGEYEIGLDYSPKGIYTEEGERLSAKTEGGVITVTSDGAVTEPDDEESNVPQFDDVSGNWAEEYIMEAAERGIVVGDKGHYYPNDNMTRAEFVMILWRVMGSPAPKGEASFIDLTADWYKEPIAWAEENKIVDGYGDGIFDPNGNVTREQMMTILHRLAGRPVGMEMMFTSVYDQSFSDSANVSAWAKNAVYWSIFNEILCGETTPDLRSELAPRNAATRSQIAVVIVRYLDK